MFLLLAWNQVLNVTNGTKNVRERTNKNVPMGTKMFQIEQKSSHFYRLKQYFKDKGYNGKMEYRARPQKPAFASTVKTRPS